MTETKEHLQAKLWLKSLGLELGYNVELEYCFSKIELGQERADIAWLDRYTQDPVCFLEVDGSKTTAKRNFKKYIRMPYNIPYIGIIIGGKKPKIYSSFLVEEELIKRVMNCLENLKENYGTNELQTGKS